MGVKICVIGFICLARVAGAETLTQASYKCERGVEIHATYVNVDNASFAIVQAEGRQLAMTNVPSASGAKYSVEAGQSGPVWWTRGDTASLSWFDANLAEEVVLYMDCNIMT